MLKRGVTRRGKFERWALEIERAHRGWWPFGYTLLAELQEHYTEKDEPLLERLYQSMAAGEGVYKITRRNRFPELDQKLLADCRERYPNARPLIIHDVGCSSGISSLDLYMRCQQERFVEVHGSDYYDKLFLVEVPGPRWTVIFDALHQPLQMVSKRYVLPVRDRPPWRYPVNRVLQRLVSGPLVATATKRLREYACRNSAVEGVREVPLFHPLAVAMTQKSNHFLLRRHNLFDPNPIACHVIRAMNVLTTKHFSEADVRRGIQSCLHNLLPGGLLLLGRSVDEEDGRTTASAYLYGPNGLEEVWRINGGYESPQLVPANWNGSDEHPPTTSQGSRFEEDKNRKTEIPTK